MEQILLKHKVINIKCEQCGKVNNIPLKYFYDGCEGPFFCKNCKYILEVDVDIED